MTSYRHSDGLAGSQSYFLQSSRSRGVCVEGLEAKRTLAGHHWQRGRGWLGEINDHFLVVETAAGYLMVGEIWTLDET